MKTADAGCNPGRGFDELLRIILADGAQRVNQIGLLEFIDERC